MFSPPVRAEGTVITGRWIEGEAVAAWAVGMGCDLGWRIALLCSWGRRRGYGSGGIAFDGWHDGWQRCGSRLEGDGNSAGQEPIGGLDAIGIRNGGLLEATRIGEVMDRMALFGYEHGVVPDGGSTHDTCYIIHG